MAVVTLHSDLGIEHSSALKDALAPHLAAEEGRVDGSAVERVHAASLQVLTAWWRDREAAGLQTGWSACSERLRSAAASLGLDTVLGLAPTDTQQQQIVEEGA